MRMHACKYNHRLTWVIEQGKEIEGGIERVSGKGGVVKGGSP